MGVYAGLSPSHLAYMWKIRIFVVSNGVHPGFIKRSLLTFVDSIYNEVSKPLDNYVSLFANVPPCPMGKTEYGPQRR